MSDTQSDRDRGLLVLYGHVCTVCGSTIRDEEDDRECGRCGEHFHLNICAHECGACSACGRERLLLNGRCQLCRLEGR